RSLTDRANTPGVSRVVDSPRISEVGQRPVLGRNPAIPQCAAGIDTEPPVSVPSAIGTAPEATAAALPPEEPPAENPGWLGIRAAPNAAFSEVMPKASSCMFVVPTTTAPARRSSATTGASTSSVTVSNTGQAAER